MELGALAISLKAHRLLKLYKNFRFLARVNPGSEAQELDLNITRRVLPGEISVPGAGS